MAWTLYEVDDDARTSLDGQLQHSEVVPNGSGACQLLSYIVQRQRGVMDESLTVCPNGASWAIAGHQMVNPESGQEIHAGLAFEVKRVHI